MTQNEKDLLLKDLSARLPYEVKVEYKNEIFVVDYVSPIYEDVKLDNCETWTVGISDVKPYLFPISSMTEEQRKEYNSLVWFGGLSAGWDRDDGVILNEVEMLIDFYHKNHLDYRGLIDKGLAIDATKLNIY